MAKFLILADTPATGDKERNFKDGNGRYIWHQLYNAGFPKEDFAIEFLFSKLGEDRWLEIERKHRPKVVLAMGQQCMENFGIEGKVLKVRGSVFEVKRKDRTMIVIPTLNFKDIKKPYNLFMDESLEKGFFVAADIRKAVDIYYNGYEPIKENFILEPTLKDVEIFVEEAIKNKWKLGLDIEATGLNLEYAEIVVIGFAWSENDAIVIPFRDKGGFEYWDPESWNYVRYLLEKLFKKCTFIAQNGVGYDIPLLRYRGWDFPLESYTDDTMILHHTIDPAQQHNIGLISSIYGKMPFWKESFINKKVSIFETDQLEMRRYNARDCIALHQIRNSMLNHLNNLIERDSRFSRLPEIYDRAMKAARVIIKMHAKGVLTDSNKITEWHRYVSDRYLKTLGKLKSLKDLPESFNFNSGDHLRYILYSEKAPNWTGKFADELKLYSSKAFNYQYECSVCGRKVTKKFYDFERVDSKLAIRCPRCKKVQVCSRTNKEPTNVKPKSKESKKYKALKEIEDLLKVEPLYKVSQYRPLKTKKGDQSAVDKKALTRYVVAIDLRLEAIRSLKRRQVRHDEEEKKLMETKEFLLALIEYSKISKLKESFWNFPTWSDGRMRPSFLITGTATGRFSSKNPNFQQYPSGETGTHIRSVFRAPEGSQLMSVDYGNLEVNIGARIFSDEELIELLEAGKNMHDENTRTFFKIDKDDPRWSSYRKVSKMIMFGRILYGGSDNGIYSNVVTAVPDSGLTLRAFKEAVTNYMEAHPSYKVWVEKVQTLAKEEKISINGYGRVRTLLGPVNSILRQALNSPIQGSAADFMIETMVLLDRAFEEANLKTAILLQIHDELVFEIPNDELEKAAKIIKEVMNREIKLNNYKFRVPIDAEIGTFWGQMDSIDLETLKIKKGSKH